MFYSREERQRGVLIDEKKYADDIPLISRIEIKKGLMHVNAKLAAFFNLLLWIIHVIQWWMFNVCFTEDLQIAITV